MEEQVTVKEIFDLLLKAAKHELEAKDPDYAYRVEQLIRTLAYIAKPAEGEVLR